MSSQESSGGFQRGTKTSPRRLQLSFLGTPPFQPARFTRQRHSKKYNSRTVLSNNNNMTWTDPTTHQIRSRKTKIKVIMCSRVTTIWPELIPPHARFVCETKRAKKKQVLDEHFVVPNFRKLFSSKQPKLRPPHGGFVIQTQRSIKIELNGGEKRNLSLSKPLLKLHSLLISDHTDVGTPSRTYPTNFRCTFPASSWNRPHHRPALQSKQRSFQASTLNWSHREPEQWPKETKPQRRNCFSPRLSFRSYATVSTLHRRRYLKKKNVVDKF